MRPNTESFSSPKPSRKAAHTRKRRPEPEPLPLVALPLAEGYIKTKLIKRVEKRFDRLWYHLYRAVVETRELQLGPAARQGEPDSEKLVEYAKRALQLWDSAGMGANGLAEEPEECGDDRAMKAVETEVARCDQELLKGVVFLEQDKLATQPADIEAAATANKYRERVLRELGLERPAPERFSMSSPSIKRAPALQTPTFSGFFLRLQDGRRQTLTMNTTAATSRRGHRAAARGPVFLTETKERKLSSPNRQSCTPLFQDDAFSPSVVRYMTQTQAAVETEAFSLTMGRQKENVPAATPLTAHARSVAKQPSPRVLATEADKQKALTKFNTQIYGKRRRHVPSVCLLACSSNGKNPALRSQHPAVGPRTQRGSVHTATTLERTRTFSIRIRTNGTGRATPLLTLGSTRNAAATERSRSVAAACDRPERAKRKLKINNLIANCLNAQQRAEADMAQVDEAKTNLETNLGGITAMLKTQDRQEKEDEDRCAKYIATQKHLFIYGKNGQGRFLTDEAKDAVRISDLMMKLNPKYPFMISRFKNIVIKTSSL